MFVPAGLGCAGRCVACRCAAASTLPRRSGLGRPAVTPGTSWWCTGSPTVCGSQGSGSPSIWAAHRANPGGETWRKRQSVLFSSETKVWPTKRKTQWVCEKLRLDLMHAIVCLFCVCLEQMMWFPSRLSLCHCVVFADNMLHGIYGVRTEQNRSCSLRGERKKQKKNVWGEQWASVCVCVKIGLSLLGWPRICHQLLFVRSLQPGN